MKRGIRHITAAIVAAGIAGGCLSPHQSTAVDVDPVAWHTAAELRLPNADTLSLRDLRLFLRCNDRFTEDSFTVRIVLRTPDSLRFEESLLIDLPRSEGPAALAREHIIPYRRQVRFARSGDYLLRITPLRPLRGVEAVGLNIVASTPGTTPNPDRSATEAPSE
ncbi:hypothetical protein [Alistipes sp.]|uniref:hypothetical protein n=1 Tax=Alistipes sp. TaxID=1872444 RepID=UPI003AF183DC